MNCPNCDTKLRVIDSRASGDFWRRRRACPKCAERYTSVEVLLDESDDGRPVGSQLVAQLLRGAGNEALRVALKLDKIERIIEHFQQDIADAGKSNTPMGKLELTLVPDARHKTA